jgi:2-hydroxychromene-2-carboxylate isomerase
MERRRWTRLFSIPMGESLPKGFPPLTLSIMRSLSALTILDSDQEKLCRALDALYKAFWVDLKLTHEPEVMVQVLTEVLGEEETRNSKYELVFSIYSGLYHGTALSNEARQLWKYPRRTERICCSKNTDKAFEDGAFGLPWFICTNSKGETEGFWGVDHLGQVTDFLGLERPKMGGWKALL